MTKELTDRFLAALGRRSVLIPDAPRVFVYERDPKDEPYINLAIAAAADYLVSRDNDILALADQTNSEGRRLRRYAPQLRILDPGSFLAEIRGLNRGSRKEMKGRRRSPERIAVERSYDPSNQGCLKKSIR